MREEGGAAPRTRLSENKFSEIPTYYKGKNEKRGIAPYRGSGMESPKKRSDKFWGFHDP